MEAILLQQYDDWLADHLEELMLQYSGRVVAIHEGKVLMVGSSEGEVYQWVREARLEPPPLVFRVPREQDFQSLLSIQSAG